MIEVLNKEDYDKIPEVYARGFGEKPWPKDWFDIPQYNPDTVWVYKEEEIMGFIISFISKGHPYISVLTVVPEHTRKGIASKLLEHCISVWFKSYDAVYIHVAFERTDATALYKKHGFKIIDEDEKNYYMRKGKV